MLLYYFIGGSVVFSLIAGYLWGNKTGHQQEQHSREATAVSLDAEIAQKKQWIEKLTESYETYKKLEQGAEKNLNLETERLLKIRDQQLLARQKDYSQKIASLDDTISRKKQEIDRLNAMLDSIMHAEHADTPYFAKQFADFLYLMDLKAASDLEGKTRPAFTAAEKVREISAQKRALQEQCKLLE